jgi:hypothetical protein
MARWKWNKIREEEREFFISEIDKIYNTRQRPVVAMSKAAAEVNKAFKKMNGVDPDFQAAAVKTCIEAMRTRGYLFAMESRGRGMILIQSPTGVNNQPAFIDFGHSANAQSRRIQSTIKNQIAQPTATLIMQGVDTKMIPLFMEFLNQVRSGASAIAVECESVSNQLDGRLVWVPNKKAKQLPFPARQEAAQ